MGNGIMKSRLQEFIKYKKLEKKIKIIKYQKNPYNILKSCDVLIHTAKYEGLPNVLVEAQLLKKSIISSDCPTGPKEILLNGRAGDLVKIGDYKMLSRLINNYSKRKKIISKMIKTGAINFERFNYKKNCEKYLSFVKSHF